MLPGASGQPVSCVREGPMSDVFTELAHELMHPLSTTRGTLSFFATMAGIVLVVIASFVRTMVPLRAFTVASNLVFLVGAALAPDTAHVLLYTVLVPLNTWRLVEIKRLSRRVERLSDQGDLSGIWLKPYMHSKRMPAGSVLFNKGDHADSLYLLVEGELELVQIDRQQAPGELFGEISFFSPGRRRTLTARCVTACVVLSIAEEAFKQLYFENPKFAFQISGLIANRLGADIERLQQKVEALQAQALPSPAAAAQPEAAAGLVPVGAG
jgi:CRP/FNR family transcriptional regulator, cyclic AMP receptor protein